MTAVQLAEGFGYIGEFVCALRKSLNPWQFLRSKSTSGAAAGMQR